MRFQWSLSAEHQDEACVRAVQVCVNFLDTFRLDILRRGDVADVYGCGVPAGIRQSDGIEDDHGVRREMLRAWRGAGGWILFSHGVCAGGGFHFELSIEW